MLCIGLAVMAFGVGFSIKAGLGTSPISSLPYVLSRLTPLTVGTATILMHVVLILLQILLLRRRYDPIQLMQLPVALVFGFLTDFAVWALQGISADNYLQQWVLCVVGILLVGVGVSMEVTANVVTLAGEGMVLAVCKVFPVKFANAKIGFDVTLVVIASVLSRDVSPSAGRRAGRYRGGGHFRGHDGPPGQQADATPCRPPVCLNCAHNPSGKYPAQNKRRPGCHSVSATVRQPGRLFFDQSCKIRAGIVLPGDLTAHTPLR